MPSRAWTAATYYREAAVQERIREYCGATRDAPITCNFVSQLAPGGLTTWERAPRFEPSELPRLFENGWDLSRSLLDAGALIVHVELDYSNPEAPGDALLRPAHTFFQLEPVYRAMLAELRRLELPLLDVMTGRGYHFTGRVPLASSVVSRLATLIPMPGGRRQRAHVGLGMVLEYLAHNVLQAAMKAESIPVVLNGTEVGRGGASRESVSIDLSEYGDPLGVRQLRVAFGTYQSHRIRPDIFGAQAAQNVPALAAVPRRERPLLWMLEHARRLDHAAAIARGERAELPDVTCGTENLLVEYEASSLREFHQSFYRVAPHQAAAWPATYDRLDERELVPCAGWALREPNDALLKPAVLQHVTRVLMAKGWEPRHVAGLVWSKYARDHGWGDRWQRLDPELRANFDIRVFAGLLATGVDEAVDFNCVSAQQKGLCPRTGCTHDLRRDRAQLLDKASV